MQFISEVYWDKGARDVNQDSLSLQEVFIKSEKAVFALVCDGIGGLAAGEIASGYVAERMTEWFYREGLWMLKKKKGMKKVGRSGLRALFGCNQEMERFGKEEGIKLGTTAAMLLLKGRRYCIWHSGDGRIYRITGRGCRGRMRQLTKDHTLDGHTLVRCIGSFAWQEPDVKSGYLMRKSSFVLCSDGFRNRVPEEKMKEAMLPGQLASREQIFMRLKEMAGYAKRHGEKDNLSAIAIRMY